MARAALFVAMVSCLAYAQGPAASDISFAARVRGGQTTFRVGEIIPLELAFASSVEGKYQLNVAALRMNYESFSVQPATGWKDPLDLYSRSGGYLGGGITTIQLLSAQPIMLPFDLNEWVRFDQPGEYRVTVQSRRASLNGQPARVGVTAASEELRLTIVAAPPEWQQETLQKGLAALNSPTTMPNSEPVRALRYLGTEAAARAMAHRSDEQNCRLGLIGSPFRAAGLDEMRKLLRDPATVIDRQFLDTITLLAIPEGPGQRFQDQNQLLGRFRQELIAAIPNKLGAALAVSIKAILENPRDVTPELRQSLADLLLANFDSLPIGDQSELLRNPMIPMDRELLPFLLRKVAQRYQEFPPQQIAESMAFNRAAGDALVQWYALAPDDARAVILKEILRPKPRFPINVLGVLPEKQLPEVEPALLEHFEASGSDPQAARNLAMLIGRYAGASAETALVTHLDRDLSAGYCDTQAPLLAWLLRVDPERARPRLENARKPGNRCLVSLAEIGRMQPGAVVERLAIQALDDADGYQVADAVAYLSDAGSAAAEDVLWSHFADWSKRWTGHEVELNSSQKDAMIGQTLQQALVTGHGWIMSDAKLKRLMDLSVGVGQRQQAQQYLIMWGQRPWLLRSTGVGQFQIGWYHAVSMVAAKEKLQQFQQGSEFRWIMQGLASDRLDFRELAQFGRDHGLTVW